MAKGPPKPTPRPLPPHVRLYGLVRKGGGLRKVAPLLGIKKSTLGNYCTGAVMPARPMRATIETVLGLPAIDWPEPSADEVAEREEEELRERAARPPRPRKRAS